MKNNYKISILIAVLILMASVSNTFAKVRTVTLRVQGLTCEMCAASLQPELKSAVLFFAGSTCNRYCPAQGPNK